MAVKDDIRKLINNHYRRLQRLKEKEALYGLSVDPGVLMEIEDIEAKIADLQEELIAQDDQHEILSQPTQKTSGVVKKNIQTSTDLIPTYHKLTLPQPNPALRDLRRWLIGK